MLKLDPNQSFAYLDDIRDQLKELLLSQKGVTKVTIAFDEEDGITEWKHHLTKDNTDSDRK